jgi:hypothetical protein
MTNRSIYFQALLTGILIGGSLMMPLGILNYINLFLIVTVLIHDYITIFRKVKVICYLFGHKLSRLSSAPGGYGQGFDKCERCPYISKVTVRHKGEN